MANYITKQRLREILNEYVPKSTVDSTYEPDASKTPYYINGVNFNINNYQSKSSLTNEYYLKTTLNNIVTGLTDETKELVSLTNEYIETSYSDFLYTTINHPSDSSKSYILPYSGKTGNGKFIFSDNSDFLTVFRNKKTTDNLLVSNNIYYDVDCKHGVKASYSGDIAKSLITVIDADCYHGYVTGNTFMSKLRPLKATVLIPGYYAYLPIKYNSTSSQERTPFNDLFKICDEDYLLLKLVCKTEDSSIDIYSKIGVTYNNQDYYYWKIVGGFSKNGEFKDIENKYIMTNTMYTELNGIVGSYADASDQIYFIDITNTTEPKYISLYDDNNNSLLTKAENPFIRQKHSDSLPSMYDTIHILPYGYNTLNTVNILKILKTAKGGLEYLTPDDYAKLFTVPKNYTYAEENIKLSEVYTLSIEEVNEFFTLHTTDDNIIEFLNTGADSSDITKIDIIYDTKIDGTNKQITCKVDDFNVKLKENLIKELFAIRLLQGEETKPIIYETIYLTNSKGDLNFIDKK